MVTTIANRRGAAARNGSMPSVRVSSSPRLLREYSAATARTTTVTSSAILRARPRFSSSTRS